ncbi:MAG: hypothetical protein ACK5IM_06245 [Demequina sp.]|uniref:hypothetical protein n=1 Tax=Demequina sp. TaxID=2050685 RepID=UPI003A863746
MTPAPVFAGPRGRRLLLELASALSPEIARLCFYAAWPLNTSGTSSQVAFEDGSVAAPHATPEQVAAAVAELDLSQITADAAWTALVAAVDAAAYWQPPGGEDALAAAPELAGVLGGLAQAVRDASALPEGDHQGSAMVIRPRDDDPTPWPVPAAAAAILQEWSARARQHEAIAARTWPTDPAHGVSSDWWSTPPHGLVVSTPHDPARGPWGLACVEDGFGEEVALVASVTVSPSARVRTISTAEDWATLCRLAPLEVTASKRSDWFHTTGRGDVRWVVPDWAAVAEEYDAVQLTLTGYLDLAGRALEVYPGVGSVIAGWNPGDTYHFGAVSIGAESPTVWRLDDQSRHWKPAAVTSPPPRRAS